MNTSGYLTTSAFFVFLGPMEGDMMIRIDERISKKSAFPKARWSHPKHQPQLTIGERIARAVHAFELRRTKHARKWVAVFMNEETIVIALHGSLTDAEKALAQSAAGAAEVREFHRRLFTDVSALLLRKIKSITGMDVRHTTAEIELTTGSFVQLFTTDTLGENFPLSPGGVVGTSMMEPYLLCPEEGRPRRQTNRTGFVIRG
jgi:uncharacterized protein YbcI